MKNKKNFSGFIFIGICIIGLLLYSTFYSGSRIEKLTYNELITTIKTKPVESLQIKNSNKVLMITGTIKLTNSKTSAITEQKFQSFAPNVEGQYDEIKHIAAEKNIKLNFAGQEGDILGAILGSVLPMVIMVAVLVFLMRQQTGGKGLDFGKNKARLDKGNKKVTFADVAGVKEEKEELMELVDYLKRPDKYQAMGARVPKGVLLVGSPGTGKTLLAKAVAGEAGVPFYTISGSDFVELFVGMGASRVREMFKEAKTNAPCIIFIDEIDAVGRQRGAGVGGGNDEREQTLNQLLVEMDGFNDNSGIIMIAATNRPDVLDPALLRPGRFDRQIEINVPDREGRVAILKVHCRNKKLESNVNLDYLAERTPGFTGADLENILNEAALLAVREKRNLISMVDLDEAIDRVVGGPAKKSRKHNEQERQVIAFHESGHAVIGLILDDAEVVQKVTIIPRGKAGGYVLMTPKEEKNLMTKKQLMARITGLLSGRVAEEIKFDDISTGAQNDIERATKIARAMVTQFGMSRLGTVQYEQPEGSVFLGRDFNSRKNFSDTVAFEIDQEVRNIIDECFAKSKEILLENASLHDLIATSLLKKEILTAEEIKSLFEHGMLPDEYQASIKQDDVNEDIIDNEEEVVDADFIEKDNN
ncbi:MAG: ATP-dependent zinc metalloprotease FtsH [Bacilli bacterium]|jgi:cell division protease FtsH|nr:ATP-dependent zinc metalloprotease FtsH [Bacilli bacterium]